MILLKIQSVIIYMIVTFSLQVGFVNVIEWKNLVLSRLSKALLFKLHLLLSIAELKHIGMLYSK